jgi:outer membrane lipoprotein-sorting protein
MRYFRKALFLLPFFLNPVVCLVSAVEVPEGAEITLEQVLESSSQKYDELEGFTCRFRQVVEIPLLEKQKEFNGRLLYRNPDKLRLDYDNPAGGYILCDGLAFYVYLPDVDSTTVMKTRLDNDPRNFLTEFFLEEARRDYNADLLYSDGDFFSLEFVPKDSRTHLLRVNMKIDKKSNLVRSVSYVDPSGSTTAYFLEGFTMKAGPEENFRFMLPEGLKLLDLTTNPE